MAISNNPMRDAIIDTAVELAACTSWEAVRLYDIAARLAVPLDEIRLYFREKDELIAAWFDRADGCMLNEAESAGFLELTASDRIHHLIMTWLDALAVQRKVTRQMIMSKLEFGHIHIQIPAVMRVSRTVQWIREAAQRDATFMRRALEESTLTTIYLMTFFFWMRDTSENSRHTRQFLKRRLTVAAWFGEKIYGSDPAKSTVPPSRQIPLQLD
ncbi:TetR family transcriptional regulator [Nitrosomonas sp. HPC101]|uniref:TetR family transcriptional regulator n=1 Tax=Nitrosomonas sp. HPC101 TaxID=1658667 RepID=UPI00136900C9|nr:TetR family transcriptional regulator [Nitrosomonas sp. HPC101]MXS85470.1 TetR family transcriptional regulator [Nitrosomonas sp. HPC101]